MLSQSPVEQKEEEGEVEEEKEAETHPNKSVSISAGSLFVRPSVRLTDTSGLPSPQTPTDTPPPLPTTPLPDDYYEEAVPLDPGSTPQYFTTNMSSWVPKLLLLTLCSPPASPAHLLHLLLLLLHLTQLPGTLWKTPTTKTQTTTIQSPGLMDTPNTPVSNNRQSRSTVKSPVSDLSFHHPDNDSDALSSSYESYEEDDDQDAKGRDQAQRWPAEDTGDGPVRDCRICAFLPRKKRFGQWTKQLVVVRDNKLQVKTEDPQSAVVQKKKKVQFV